MRVIKPFLGLVCAGGLLLVGRATSAATVTGAVETGDACSAKSPRLLAIATKAYWRANQGYQHDRWPIKMSGCQEGVLVRLAPDLDSLRKIDPDRQVMDGGLVLWVDAHGKATELGNSLTWQAKVP